MTDSNSPLKSVARTAAANPRARKLVSIVMPVRNEEGNLPRAYDEVTALMALLPYDYEVLLIDNDSIDRTGELSAELCRATLAGDISNSAAISRSRLRWRPVIGLHGERRPSCCSAICKTRRN